MQKHPPPPLDFDQAPEEELADLELDTLALDSDDGLTAPMISDDPEHDRLIDPED